jgi:hypothetical protein
MGPKNFRTHTVWLTVWVLKTLGPIPYGLKPAARNSLELINIATGGRDVSTSGVHSWNVSPDASSCTLLSHRLMTRTYSCCLSLYSSVQICHSSLNNPPYPSVISRGVGGGCPQMRRTQRFLFLSLLCNQKDF